MPFFFSARPLAAALLCLALAACGSSAVPRAGHFPITTQNTLRAAGHWQLLAQEAAARTVDMVRTHHAPDAAQPSFYVEPAHPKSDFGQAFRELLISALVARGQVVHPHPAQADVVLNYSAQVVAHPNAQGSRAWEMLHLSQWLDSGRTGSPSDTEVVLTTSAMQQGRYVARSTQTYYLPDGDASMFSTQRAALQPAVRVLKVVNQ